VPPLTPMPPDMAAAASFPSLNACWRGNGRTTLYVHIYDEPSRLPATALRQVLSAGVDSPVLVAPIENVIRSADLRQQRRPVPWPKPTLVLHDPLSRDCARSISRFIGVPWVLPGDTDTVWLRDLPRTLQARPGVIELWLPPTEVTTSENNVDRPEIVGALTRER
jgi:hypothetical protein